MNVNAFLVVWRETLEAALVIGILLAWLERNPVANGRNGQRSLWLGVAGGIGLALGLGGLMLGIAGELEGEWLEHFQTAMLLAACLLITHMVLWMAQHGRMFKAQLEDRLAAQAGRSLGIASIAALAVGREGAETVIFLYGLSLEAGLATLFGSAAGILAALTCAWLMTRSLRQLPLRQFFRITGLLLLVFAAALLVAAIERLIGQGLLPPLIDPLWDSSALLDVERGAGRLLADFLGYRAQPSLMLLLCYAGYWALVLRLQKRKP